MAASTRGRANFRDGWSVVFVGCRKVEGKGEGGGESLDSKRQSPGAGLQGRSG